MDVSVQLAAGNAAALDSMGGGAGGARQVGQQAGAAPQAQVLRHGEAFGRLQPAPADSNMAGVIDRIRNDFDSFRARLATGSDTRRVDAAATPGTFRLTEAMDAALRTQMDIFEMAVTFNAGLTASQQSQSGIKTLIEKS